MTCDPGDMTIGVSCTNLLSIYLDYQLHLLFALAATMLMVNKDYHSRFSDVMLKSSSATPNCRF